MKNLFGKIEKFKSFNLGKKNDIVGNMNPDEEPKESKESKLEMRKRLALEEIEKSKKIRITTI